MLEDKIPFLLFIPIDLVLGVPAVGPGARDMSLPERACGGVRWPGPCHAGGMGWDSSTALLLLHRYLTEKV